MNALDFPQLTEDVHDDGQTPETLASTYRRPSVFTRRQSVATMEFLRGRRDTLHRVSRDSPEDDRSSVEGYGRPNGFVNTGYGRWVERGSHHPLGVGGGGGGGGGGVRKLS